MHEIKEKENLLFEKYRKSNPEVTNVVIDGLICEDEYFSSKYKLVYILKEVNGGESWDLREFLAEGGRGATWNNIARWTEGIFNLSEEKSWEYWKSNNEERRKKQRLMVVFFM